MRTATRVTAALVLLTACTDIISPPRVEHYEYRKFVFDSEGDLVPMAFHWPREWLPVRVWVADDDPLRPHVIAALRDWENAYLYGEFRAELVSRADQADIVVRNQVAPPKLMADFRFSLLAPECRGETAFTADVDAGRLALPFEVYVWSRVGPDGENLDRCYQLSVLHEIGHTLGIFEHSPSIDDLMYADAVVTRLSVRDKATAEAAAHLPATLLPVR
jgi:predicted Zn-dependent protease